MDRRWARQHKSRRRANSGRSHRTRTAPYPRRPRSMPDFRDPFGDEAMVENERGRQVLARSATLRVPSVVMFPLRCGTCVRPSRKRRRKDGLQETTLEGGTGTASDCVHLRRFTLTKRGRPAFAELGGPAEPTFASARSSVLSLLHLLFAASGHQDSIPTSRLPRQRISDAIGPSACVSIRRNRPDGAQDTMQGPLYGGWPAFCSTSGWFLSSCYPVVMPIAVRLQYRHVPVLGLDWPVVELTIQYCPTAVGLNSRRQVRL
jgi:hypothetical protein